jgi:hypothetical protein
MIGVALLAQALLALGVPAASFADTVQASEAEVAELQSLLNRGLRLEGLNGPYSGAGSCGGATAKAPPCQLPAYPPEGFGKPNFGVRGRASQDRFIEWVRPLALRIQAITGLPASLLITQAGMESGFGVDSVYRRKNNLMGITCDLKNEPRVRSYAIDLGDGVVHRFTAGCQWQRSTFPTHFRVFEKPEQSILVWAYALITNPATQRQYGTLRDLAAEGRRTGTPLASSRFISALGKYAVEGDYRSALRAIYRVRRLRTIFDRLDASTQVCPDGTARPAAAVPASRP